jgi:hypothetical protein
VGEHPTVRGSVRWHREDGSEARSARQILLKCLSGELRHGLTFFGGARLRFCPSSSGARNHPCGECVQLPSTEGRPTRRAGLGHSPSFPRPRDAGSLLRCGGAHLGDRSPAALVAHGGPSSWAVRYFTRRSISWITCSVPSANSTSIASTARPGCSSPKEHDAIVAASRDRRRTNCTRGLRSHGGVRFANPVGTSRASDLDPHPLMAHETWIPARCSPRGNVAGSGWHRATDRDSCRK